MIENIIEDLSAKKVVILGFGLEGKSTYSFIRRHSDMPLVIADKNKSILSDEKLKKDNNLSFICGDDYLEKLNEFDIIIKSPGIFLEDESLREKITSQLNLILKYNKKNVIGVTGTKGKSTTSSLIYEAIKATGNDVFLLGNIGKPILDQIENMNEKTFLVIECSAHQLQFVNYSPSISVILNLLEDHLDFFKTVENYHKMKLNIFKYQSREDVAIYLSECKNISNYLTDEFLSKKVALDFHDTYGTYLEKKYEIPEMKIIGENNKKNALIALAVCDCLNLDLEKAKSGLSEFNGLEHRMEFVGKYDDVLYYNDMIATIPEATISAVLSIKIVDTLIIGGMDRGINYDILVDFLNKDNVGNLICMPTTGHKIAKLLKEDIKTNVYLVNDLEEAVQIAKKVTKKDKACLISPAASSYEYYKNFQEKGKHFKELVKK